MCDINAFFLQDLDHKYIEIYVYGSYGIPLLMADRSTGTSLAVQD